MVEMFTSDKKTNTAENAETIKKNLSMISKKDGSKRGLLPKSKDKKDGVVLEEKFQNYIAQMLEDDQKGPMNVK